MEIATSEHKGKGDPRLIDQTGFLLKAGQGDQPLPGGWRSGEDEESDQIWKRVLLVS